jgi:hypothetical protein
MSHIKVPFNGNVIHDKALVVGQPAEDSHIAEKGYVYRSVGGQTEIDSILENDMALPPPNGKSKGGRIGIKHWSRADDRLYYRGDQTVIRVRSENICDNAPVLAEHIEVKRAGENSFTPIKEIPPPVHDLSI